MWVFLVRCFLCWRNANLAGRFACRRCCLVFVCRFFSIDLPRFLKPKGFILFAHYFTASLTVRTEPQSEIGRNRGKKRHFLLQLSFFWWYSSSITLRRRQRISRADLQLLITAKEKEAAEAGDAQPQAPAVAVLGLLGQQSTAALDCWNCSLPFPPQCNIIIVPSSFTKHT